VAEKSWAPIQASWKQSLAKGPGEEPLIASFEVDGVALFALPVFPAGVPATVRAALAPEGDAFWWIACESRRARLMRKSLTDVRGVSKDWIRATGYWKNADSDDG
jgi:hypothetical protein